MPGILFAAAALFVAGLLVTFGHPGFRGRLPGLAAMAGGAVVMLASAPPRPALGTTATVAVTLGVMLVVADRLARRLERRNRGTEVTLDDEPR